MANLDGRVTSAAAIVLAGGRSSRMGRPKALLPFAGEPLLVHVVRTVRSVVDEVVVVASPDQQLPDVPALIVRDGVAFQGPVAGLTYGLEALSAKVAYVTSCDAVFLDPRVMRLVLARIEGHDAAVPVWNGRLQPLHAAWRRTVLPHLGERLAAGDLRLTDVLDAVRAQRIDEREVREIDPEGWSFFNMNTPEDYERALQLWPRLRGDASAPSDRC
ncbi:MAG TPA: molybdenum cofactor guanylyltransferase [Vicinamibacterales bacterium]